MGDRDVKEKRWPGSREKEGTQTCCFVVLFAQKLWKPERQRLRRRSAKTAHEKSADEGATPQSSRALPQM